MPRGEPLGKGGREVAGKGGSMSNPRKNLSRKRKVVRRMQTKALLLKEKSLKKQKTVVPVSEIYPAWYDLPLQPLPF